MTAAIWLCRGWVIFSAALLAYPYLVYPSILWLLTRLRPRGLRAGTCEPRVTMLIAAYNEAGILRAKLANTLEQDYPPERLQVVVASDGSSDGTVAIARSFGERVSVLDNRDRAGKQTTLNRAVAAADGEVFLFSDAAVMLSRDGVRQLVSRFADPTVGAVSSVIHIVDGLHAGHAEGDYLNFDIRMRVWEGRIGSAVGCCGSCYAVRRECFVPFDAGAASDFASASDAVAAGYRTVFDPSVVGTMRPAQTAKQEFRRKVRTIAGGIDTFLDKWQGPLPPLFRWKLVSHKFLRWLGPPVLLLALVACVAGAVSGDPWQQAGVSLALLGLLTGLAGAFGPQAVRRLLPLRLAGFALVSWWGGIAAWVQVLRGRRQVVWEPTKRSAVAGVTGGQSVAT